MRSAGQGNTQVSPIVTGNLNLSAGSEIRQVDEYAVKWRLAGTGTAYVELAAATTSWDSVVNAPITQWRWVLNATAVATLSTAGAFSALASIRAHSATAVPAGGTAGVGLLMSSTANLGVFFGSGVPTLAAARGSLYLRTDGSSTSTRAYINTDGGTTWTAITTAA